MTAVNSKETAKPLSVLHLSCQSLVGKGGNVSVMNK